MNFEDFAGNERLKNRLIQSVADGKILNAYIFSGDVGSGKKTLSDLFAFAIICENPDEHGACGICRACRQSFSGNHPDVIYLKKQEDKKTTGIDDVRDNIIKNVFIKPFSAPKKIFIIQDGDSMTIEAQNALLKVLEEPPYYVTFIILATKISSLLDTILSRCLVMNLHPVSYNEVRKYLKVNYNEADDVTLDFCAKFSQGIIGKAIRMLTDTDYRSLYSETSMLIIAFLSKNATIIELRHFLTENKDHIDTIIENMLIFLRDCLLSCEGLYDMVSCYAEIDGLNLKIDDRRKFVSMIESVLLYKTDLSANLNFSAATLKLLTDFNEIWHLS